MPDRLRTYVSAVTERSRRADLVAVAILVAAPLLFFGIPGLMGHPVLNGDNLYQNLPMRTLAGDQLRQGTFPLFNPYIWSGSPLLGGWNAGAMYPFTFLFAVLPATAAWVLNEMLVYWVAALGLYLFLRASGLRPVAGLLGAASFAFAGSMASQMVHFGVVAGMSWVPLMLVALLELSRRPTANVRIGWIAVLGVSGGMCVLAGEPRAIDEAVIIAMLYVAWRTIRIGRAAIGFLVSASAGLGLAVLLGAVQWLPGLSVVATSQRSGAGYSLFSSGSLPGQWLLLLGVPDLVGGSGSFGQPSFFAHYNLGEVTSYVGILPIVGAVALLATLRWRRPVPEWLGWIGIALVGVVLALGGGTPLGPALSHIPLFGGQRLQSRNILVTDLALGVVLAYWVQHTIDGPVHVRPRAVTADPGSGRRSGSASRASRISGSVPLASRSNVPSASRRTLVVSLVVPIVVAVVVIVAIAFPSQLAGWMQAFPSQVGNAGQLWPSLLPFLFVAIMVGTFLVMAPRLDRHRRVQFVSLIVLVDLAAFTVTSLFAVDGGRYWQSVPAVALPPTSAHSGSATASAGSSQTSTGVSASFAGSVGRTGRFAIFDPLLIGGLPSLVGQPDLNIQAGQYSAQGYSAIVDNGYAAATGSHAAMGEGTNALTPAAIGNGVLDQLDTKTLFTPSGYLVTPVAPPGEPSANSADPAITPPADPRAAQRTVTNSDRATWFVGTPLSLVSITVPVHSPAATTPGARIGLVQADGAVVWATAGLSPVPDTVSAHFDRPVQAVAVTIQTLTVPVTYGAPTLTASSGQQFVADGQLQGVRTLSHWRFSGTDGLFAVFANERATPPLTLQPTPGGSLAGASIRRRSGSILAPESAAVSSPNGVIVVRSMAAIPGWDATWQPSSGGQAVDLPVRALGVVQGVEVPPGSGTLTWSYRPDGAWVGLWLSVAGLVTVLGLSATWALRQRRAARIRRGP